MSDKKLLIAEKPSVARDIAQVVGATGASRSGFYENDEYVICCAVGHLLEIIPPEGAEVARGKWRLENLPVLPEHFDLQPIEKTQKQLTLLDKLYRRKDIAQVINACDAGREGEMIFQNIYRHLTRSARANKKPVTRLWLQSMTKTAISSGLANVQDNQDFQPLAAAAQARAEADWLVGINATRAVTALNSRHAGFLLTTVGRVQTPTLTMLVNRESEIQSFVAEPYHEIHATFRIDAGDYRGSYINPEQKKTPKRIFDAQRAREITESVKSRSGTIEDKTRDSSIAPPVLFDLTKLQREANRIHGLSASATLAAAQRLYERHKLITYPRTRSRCLPQDYVATVTTMLQRLSAASGLGEHARRILDSGWVNGNNRRIFDDKKVSDHFAIIPTGERPRASMTEIDHKIFMLIVRQTLAAFFPPVKLKVTERITTVETHRFQSSGKVVLEPGWWAVSDKSSAGEILPPAQPEEAARVEEVECLDKVTTPPPRFSEATLLSMMEGAGKLVDDDQLREVMSDIGIGTPATRASIIETLIREKYVVRQGQELIPTTKASSLIRLLRGLKIDQLTQPELTGEWERRLLDIECATASSSAFRSDICDMTRTIVQAVKSCEDVDSVAAADLPPLASPCPLCGGRIRQNHTRFFCASCQFFFWKSLAGREFSSEEAEQLLREKQIAQLEGFRSRRGTAFDAGVRLSTENNGKIEFIFPESDGANQAVSAEELMQGERLGASCPRCQGDIYTSTRRYVCLNSTSDNGKCDFTFPVRMLDREMKPAEVAKLLNDGITDLLQGFVSKKTKRPFSAKLKLSDGSSADKKAGEIEFVFDKKPAKKSATKSTAKSKAGVSERKTKSARSAAKTLKK